MFIGAGTAINVAAVLAGGGLGLLVGGRLPDRTRTVVTQILGLVTLVIAGLSIAQGMSEAFAIAVGPNTRLLIVLAALLVGGVVGSLLRLEERLDGLAERLRRRFASRSAHGTFVEGMVTSTLIFCVGPLAILGSLSDGMGHGTQQLIIKSVMDGFAAMAFASSLGVGVLFAALPLAIYQGTLTMIGLGLGSVLPAAQLDALTATGGVILLGLGVRLLGLKAIPLADLLPALIVAPVAVAIVGVII